MSNLSTENVIGFAGVYYTLWVKYKETVQVYLGNNTYQARSVDKANYIKNISKSLDEAKALYPDAKVDLSFKGKHWEAPIRIAVEKEPLPIDIFQFGKYYNQKVAECKDLQYLEWYSYEVQNRDQADFVKKCLDDLYTENGYKCLKGHWYTPTEYNIALEEEKFADSLIEKINSHEPLDCIFGSNFKSGNELDNDIVYNVIDTMDQVFISHAKGLSKVRFILTEGNYVERWYDGYNYYLPAINGKGKRIKNNVMRITEYEVEEPAMINGEPNFYDMNIIIKKFEVIKK